MQLGGGPPELVGLLGKTRPRVPGPGPRHRGHQVLAPVVAVQRGQAPDAGRGQRPAVTGPGQVARQHPEQDRVAVQLGLDPAVGRRHVHRAQPGQGRGHLQVGVRAGEQPAEHLEDGGLAEDHAGVALLGGDHAAAGPRPERHARLAAELQRAGRPLLRHARQQAADQVGIVQGVVDGGAVRQLPDDRVGQPVRDLPPQPDQHLVPGVGRDSGLAHGDDQVPQGRFALRHVTRGQRGVRRDGQAADGRALAGEPALPRQPRRQQAGQGVDGHRGARSLPRSPD